MGPTLISVPWLIDRLGYGCELQVQVKREAAGVAAKAGGVKHFSLVTAQGAKDVWVPHTALHPLLYAKTKFQAQQVRHPRSLSPACTLRTFC